MPRPTYAELTQALSDAMDLAAEYADIAGNNLDFHVTGKTERIELWKQLKDIYTQALKHDCEP